MASSTLQKLLKNQSASIISTFLRQNHVLTTTQIAKPYDTTALWNPPETECLRSNHDTKALWSPPETECLRSNRSAGESAYPSFPFGLFLGPASFCPSILPEPDYETAADESNIIRADSVKKKRKKKMNKHKLRKLRKRLMRKT